MLSALLGFFDDEPAWTRFLILQPRVAAGAVTERRQQALRALAHALERATQNERITSRALVRSPALLAELIVGGVFSVIRAQIVEGGTEPLHELAPALTALIVGPYQSQDEGSDLRQTGSDRDRRDTHFERLPVRTTYRTTRVLSAIGASPMLSNREIADAAGLSDEGQTSKLLRRLAQRGLVENVGLGQPHGEANAWLLTAYGERMLDATRRSLAPGAGAIASHRIRGAA